MIRERVEQNDISGLDLDTTWHFAPKPIFWGILDE